MRNWLTPNDVGQKTGYTGQQVRNKWAAGELQGIAELANPGGKQLRFKKTTGLLSWCASQAQRRAGLAGVDVLGVFQAVREAEDMGVKFYRCHLHLPDNLTFDQWKRVMEILIIIRNATRHLPRSPRNLRPTEYKA